MTLKPDDAAASLSEIAAVEQRTRQTLAYARSSTAFILWGTLVAIGYAFGHFFPHWARIAWLVWFAIGFASCAVLVMRRPRRATTGRLDLRLLYAQLVLYAYGWVFVALLAPTPRQLGVFWPNVFMLGIVIAGLWLGRFFVVCGLSVTALSALGFFWAGDLFELWMAAVNGGGLIACGLALRRMGGEFD
jgi:hypothetical protein